MEFKIPVALTNELEVYTDTDGLMRLLGPTGWTCSAEYGADGSGGVAIYRPGDSLSQSAFGAGWALSSDSSTEAIVGSQTSACQGCTVGQACPLFHNAATNYQSMFGRTCPKTRPSVETVERIAAGVVAFEDPPGMNGDGSPSGGRFAANGVETYYPNSDSGSWIDTCTLPRAERALCTTTLNNFIALYGMN